ncbi:MAG: S8 family peptidase [Bacteroidota bacterium]
MERIKIHPSFWLHFFLAAFSLVLLNPSQGMSQSGVIRKYLVYFRNKDNNGFSVDNPEQYLTQRSIQRRRRQNIPVKVMDMPVTPAYRQALAQVPGVNVWYTSRWLNAALIECDTDVVAGLDALPFIQNTERLTLGNRPGKKKNGLPGNTPGDLCRQNLNICSIASDSNISYGASQNQVAMLGADSMHAAGFTGQGKIIAILDAGFQGAKTHAAFRALNGRNGILGVYDFVTRDSVLNVNHPHGGQVFSLMGAYAPGNLIGTAFDASFYLFRTEDAPTEKREELAYWLIGAERADSMGADLINSSLGYTNGMTDPSRDYLFSDMNGRTTPASKAATLAASVGILVVVAAGNQGEDMDWGGHIGAPADADSIITVGSVTAAGTYSSFSSRGPTADGRIKPDLSAQGSASVVINPGTADLYMAGSGTSFASPILCGFAASFWSAHPELTSFDVLNILKASGSQADTPDNYAGWGIPNLKRAQSLLASGVEKLNTGKGFLVYPNPANSSSVSITVLSNNTFSGVCSIEITNASGKVIKAAENVDFGEAGRINYSLPEDIATGVYFIKISNQNSGKRVIKFVKQ